MQTIKQASVRSNCPVCGKNLQVSLKSARVVEDETVYCSKRILKEDFKGTGTKKSSLFDKTRGGDEDKANFRLQDTQRSNIALRDTGGSPDAGVTSAAPTGS